MKNRILALLLALTLVSGLALAGCSAPTADNSAAPSASADPAPTESISVDLSRHILDFAAGISPETTALTINGQEVSADLFLYWLAVNCTYFDGAYGTYGLTVADYADTLLKDSVSMAAYYSLLSQRALELGCPLTDEQLAEKESNMMNGGQEAYETRKALYGLTDDTMDFVFSVAYYYNNLLDTLVPVPTEEDLNNYVYQARHILLLTVDMEGTPELQDDGTYSYPRLDDETIAEKRALAEDLLAQLRASDDPDTLFNELMNEYSEDTGLAANPDGYIATAGQMVPEFENTALALEFGEISDIVESSYGYHIILRGQVDDLDSYADTYREAKLDEQITQWLDQADIVESEFLQDLDVASFYSRYSAYQAQLAATLEQDTQG